jgi:hypothetical protein
MSVLRSGPSYGGAARPAILRAAGLFAFWLILSGADPGCISGCRLRFNVIGMCVR